jgi:hypothetical protein
MEELPLLKRVTHPGNHGFPDATFDYLFSVNAASTPALTHHRCIGSLSGDVRLHRKKGERMKYWKIIGNILSKAGCVAAIDREGRTIFQEWLNQKNVGLMFCTSSTTL